MHPFSILTLGIFVAGYITARWDLVTRLYELAIFAWDHSVVVSSVLGHPLAIDSCVRSLGQPKAFVFFRSSFFCLLYHWNGLPQGNRNWYCPLIRDL